MERTWLQANLRAGPEKTKVCHPSPDLGIYIPPTTPTVGLSSGMQPGERNAVFRPCGLYMGLNPVQASV